MERRVTAGRLMIEAAALAGIEELAKAGGREDRRSQMTNHEEAEVPAATEAGRELKAAESTSWRPAWTARSAGCTLAASH
jgi:hypothetical protein